MEIVVVKEEVIVEYSCFYCTQSFENEYDLNYHVKTHNFKDLKLQDFPPIDIKVKEEPAEEIASKTDVQTENYLCSCGLYFPTKRKIENHARSVHFGIVFYCDLCPRVSHFKRDIRYHVRTHSKGFNDSRPHQCEQCEKKFTIRSRLDKHRISHSNERPYSCEVCKKTYKSEVYLKRHSAVHNGSENCFFECYICKRRFATQKGLKLHIHNIHPLNQNKNPDSETISSCFECKKNFKSAQILKQHHQITHSNLRPYKCEKCHWTFKSSSDLKCHFNRIHSEIRPYKCDFCSVACKLKKDLHRHRLLHLDSKPIKCTLCKKSFVRPYRLRDHIATAHSEN